MINKLRFFAFLLAINSVFCQFSMAQADLRNDSDFFLAKKAETDYWLAKTGIAQIFKLKDIEVTRDKLRLKFKSNLNTADSTITAWNLLKLQHNPSDNLALARQLFNSLAFEMEVGKDSMELVLTSPLEDYTITISYDGKDGVAMVEDTYLIPTRTFKTIVIKLDDLSLTGGAANIVAGKYSVKEIRKTISNFLKEYYKPKGTFWYDSQLDILKENSNELTFEVTKLSKEILNDRNYFEYIRIEIKIQRKEKNIEIKSQIQGKYSSGFGFAPRRTEYRNMEPDYSDYIIRYGEKIAQKINQLLTR